MMLLAWPLFGLISIAIAWSIQIQAGDTLRTMLSEIKKNGTIGERTFTILAIMALGPLLFIGMSVVWYTDQHYTSMQIEFSKIQMRIKMHWAKPDEKHQALGYIAYLTFLTITVGLTVFYTGWVIVGIFMLPWYATILVIMLILAVGCAGFIHYIPEDQRQEMFKSL